PLLPLIDRQEVVFHGEAEDGHAGGVDLTALALFATHPLPRAVARLERDERFGHDALAFVGILSAALVHALRIVIGEVVVPALAAADALLEEAIGSADDLLGVVFAADLEGEQAFGCGRDFAAAILVTEARAAIGARLAGVVA